MPDLAHAMKNNPRLKIQLNVGYFDLLTPHFWRANTKYAICRIPPELRGNIELHCYQAGHMVYLSHDALVRLHDNVANFIRGSDG